MNSIFFRVVVIIWIWRITRLNEEQMEVNCSIVLNPLKKKTCPWNKCTDTSLRSKLSSEPKLEKFKNSAITKRPGRLSRLEPQPTPLLTKIKWRGWVYRSGLLVSHWTSDSEEFMVSMQQSEGFHLDFKAQSTRCQKSKKPRKRTNVLQLNIYIK